MKIEYTQLEKHHDIDYFTDPDVFVPKKYRLQIKPLTHKSADQFWEKYISAYNKHTMLLNENDWFNNVELEAIANWQNDWNENNYTRITNILKDKVSWPEDTTIYFCWSNTNIIETTWSIFTSYWINFLFDDEGPILITKENDELFTIGPGDNISYGCKTNG